MLKAVRRFLPMALAVGLLVYTLRGLPLALILDAWHQSGLGWVELGFSITLIQLVLRGLRWRMLLISLGYQPGLGRTLTAMLAGNAASMVIPGSGELIRCTVIARTNGVSMTQGIGSVVAERLLDLFGLLVLLLLSLPFGAGQFFAVIRRATSTSAHSEYSTPTYGLILALSLVVLGVGIWGWKRYGAAITVRLNLHERLNGLKKGLLSVKEVRPLGWFIGLNGLIHLLSLMSLWVWLMAVPTTAHLPISVVPVLFAVLSLGGLTIPTQANVGTFHFLASRVLMFYGLQKTDAVVWATFSHALSTLLNMILSGIGFLLAARVLRRPTNTVTEPKTLINDH